MAGVGADFQKRSHFADEFQVIANHRSAADIFLGVDGEITFRLAEGGEVVKLHLRALDGE